jgi:signal transduction histidine kinase
MQTALSDFITKNLERILQEWERFATTLLPSAATLDSLALRDHASEILTAIAAEMRLPQTAAESSEKSRGKSDCAMGIDTAAAVHGALRHDSGFDLRQLFAEFRALRASVLRLWAATHDGAVADVPLQITRFNEGIDQALAESVARFCEDVERSRDTFVAVLGHGLRSPLHAISAAAAALANPGLPPAERAGALDRIRADALSMSAVIGDLLELTRTRLGKVIPIKASRVDFERVIWRALDELAIAHPQASVRAEVGADLVADADAPRLQQAITNLLLNAVEHGRAGGSIGIVARRELGFVCIEVSNTGPSIPPERLQVVFDPMSLQHAAVERRPGEASLGTHVGLGLFIAREIAVGHGGTIQARSSDERTTFTLRLPLEQAAKAPAPPLSLAA